VDPLLDTEVRAHPEPNPNLEARRTRSFLAFLFLWGRKMCEGGSEMEVRITRLEGSVEHIRGDISEIKTDIHELRGDTQRLLWAGISAMGLIIGGAWMMYSKLSADINAVQDKLGNKLADLQATVEHIAGYLDGQQHPGPKNDIPTATAPGAPRH
jgi:hypothetical protein